MRCETAAQPSCGSWPTAIRSLTPREDGRRVLRTTLDAPRWSPAARTATSSAARRRGPSPGAPLSHECGHAQPVAARQVRSPAYSKSKPRPVAQRSPATRGLRGAAARRGLRCRRRASDVPEIRANRVSWRATVELRRNTNAGLGPRGGRPRVCRNPTEVEVSSLIGGVPETSLRSWEQKPRRLHDQRERILGE